MAHDNLWSQDIYLKAIRFAGAAHGDQKIPGSDLPYAIHLTNVCMEIMAAICAGEVENPDLAVQCALLHDSIEDTGLSFEEIKMNFGQDVADGILALTKNGSIEKNLRMSDSIERIKRQPREVWMVKIADRITNLQPPPSHWSKEKISGYRREAEMILEQLGSASTFLGERLRRKIENYP
jgi:(p)ppGpp synthase/HD superfamily hydrolase